MIFYISHSLCGSFVAKITVCYVIIMISFPVVSFLTTVLVDLSMQEWAETVGSASLLDTLFKALDEVWFL